MSHLSPVTFGRSCLVPLMSHQILQTFLAFDLAPLTFSFGPVTSVAFDRCEVLVRMPGLESQPQKTPPLMDFQITLQAFFR